MSNAPESPIPVNEHQATRERVGAVAFWLVEGKLRPECVAAAMQEWQVSRRTAQVYVARAAARIVKATTFEDPLFALKLSQVQRDRLHQELQELLRKGEFMPLPHWKMKIQTIQADLKLFDSRDRTAAKIVQMEEKNGKAEERRTQRRLREEARAAKETLRPETPPAPIVEKTKPQPQPRPIQIAPEILASARAAMRGETAQPAAHIAIVPGQPKDKAGKDMRPRHRPERGPAPGDVSCALETKSGGNKVQAGTAPDAPAAGTPVREEK